jgi:alkanesulfonate monooxygenase SsuD/methylene tetrahydromethanopterin reductase-like flavin-dependent oxidoreductase (luciferase family)
LAKQAANVQEISNGRLMLGLGAGWNEAEYAAFGLPFEKRISRFAEAFAIIAPLARGERVTLQGEYFSVDDAVLLPPLTKPIPLMIGSNGPRMLSIALRESAAWNTWYASYGNTPEGFAALNAEITAEINKRLGLTLTDAFCGFKAYSRRALEAFSITETGYAMPLEVWVQAAAAGLRIVELPVPLVYLDLARSFGGALDDAATRLAYYRRVLDRAEAAVAVGPATGTHAAS